MGLINSGNFYLNSGMNSSLKVDCDFLTDSDIMAAAYILKNSIPKYGLVIGIPSGGMRLANAMKVYEDKNDSYVLIVDDVFTTGGSMERYRDTLNDPTEVYGAVLFARAETPNWITPLFQLNPNINHKV